MTPTAQKNISAALDEVLLLAAKSHKWHVTAKPRDNLPAHLALGDLYELCHKIFDGLSEPLQGGVGFQHQSVGAISVPMTVYNDKEAILAVQKMSVICLGKILEEIKGQEALAWYKNQVEGFQNDLNQILYRLR
jgi:hypothetical protein